MNLFIYQLKQAYLSLKQKPGFVFSVVSTMGITLGALLCVLTLAYVMLLKPLPYPEQSNLYKIEQQVMNKENGVVFSNFTYPALIDLYHKQTFFSQAAIVSYSQEIIRSHATQPKVMVGYVSPEWFNMLNTPFMLGRAFDDKEGVGKNQAVAILSYHSWQKNYGADSKILGKKIDIKGQPFKIIGVTDPSFVDPQLQGLDHEVQIWLPWDFNAFSYLSEYWDAFNGNLMLLASPKSQYSVSQVEQQLSTMVNDWWQPKFASDAYFSDKHLNIKALSIKSVILGDTTSILFLLLLGCFGLLIIASSNVANLFIAYSAQQKPNLAINAALGATRKQLFNYFYAQALLLMSVTVLVTLLVANFGFLVLYHYINEFLPRVSELQLQPIMILVIVVIAVLLALMFTHLSANTIYYRSLATFFETSGKGTTRQIPKKIRNTLITVQVAVVSLLVFTGMALVVQSAKVISQPLGYQRDNVSYLEVSTFQREGEGEKAPTFEDKLLLNNQLKSALLALSEVESIAIAESPLNGFSSAPMVKKGENLSKITSYSYGDESYFNLIGQTLLLGEYFPEQQQEQLDLLVIVNDVYARQHSSIENVIGQQISIGRNKDEFFTIIGVVQGISEPGFPDIQARVYLPSSPIAAKFLVKTKQGQQLSRERLIKTISSVNSFLTVYEYDALSAKHQWIVLPQLISVVSAIVVTCLSLFLAAIGLYGILSYSSQVRRFEIGTRLAIGAKGKDIVWLILTDNTAPLLMGIVVSLTVLFSLYVGFSEYLNAYINLELIPLFVLTLLIISLTSFFACYLPLRQYIKHPVIHSLRGN